MDEPAPIPSDVALLERMATGEVAALRDLYQRYARAVYSWATSVTGSSTSAEEVTERVFTAAWERSRQTSTEVNVPAWLFALAQDMTGDRSPDPDLWAVWLGGQAASSLDTMPLRQAEALRLVGHEARSLGEAARILGVTEDETRRAVFDGLAALTTTLGPPA